MTKTTEKVFNGNMSKAFSLIGVALLLLGVVLLAVKAASVEYVDASGMLHENFFLLPCGFLSIFGGLMCLLTALGRKIVLRFVRKK